MGWSGLTLVTDADLGALEPEAVSGAWRSTSWPNQRTEAKRDLKIWLERDFPKIPGVVDRIRDTYKSDSVLGFTAGSYSDVSDATGDDTEDDVTLSSIFVTPASDYLYVGTVGEIDGLQVAMLAHLNANASVLSAAYSGAGGWTNLTITDGTSTGGATFAKSGRISWAVPSDWQRRTLNDRNTAYFWIRLSISAALTSGTSIGQLLVVKAPDGLKRVCALRALGYIYKNLAAQSPSTDYWGGRTQNQFKTGYWDIADELYATLRDKGGIPIDVDDDGTIDQATELEITIEPTRLERA